MNLQQLLKAADAAGSAAPEQFDSPIAVRNFPKIYFPGDNTALVQSFLHTAFARRPANLVSADVSREPDPLPEGTIILDFDADGDVTVILFR